MKYFVSLQKKYKTLHYAYTKCKYKQKSKGTK